ADVQIFNSSIHHNKGGIMSDETLRYFIRDNHIYSNDGTGIALGCSTVWTDDLNVVVDDKHQVLNNLVEDNADFGVWLSICSNSTVAGNVIRGNNIGFSFAIAKSLYRKNIGDIVTIGRIGRDRTMNNLIANNTVYDNFRNLEITFNSGGMADWIDYDSPYYLPFDNYFQNNSFGGREVEYYYGSSNGVFNMKNLNAFICMGCSNITIFNSSISELYLAYCNDTDEDADIYNILSEDPYNAITKFIAHGIYFENYTVKRARNGVAYENGSENNTFVNIFLSGSEGNCVDSDGDGYGVCPACGFESGCAKSGDDCDDSNPNVYPGAREVYDFVDNDCDGLIDLEDRDLFKQSCLCDFNKDGLVSFPDINIISATSGSENCGYYGNPETDWCNFTDVNRDGLVNNVDMSIFILWINAGTCDCSLGPELCDGYDNDCDGKVDEVFCCGDGKCDELETCSNCAGDCGACSHESPGGPGNPMGPGGYRYQCSDGIDNDADGLIDYPADPGCDSTNDNSELDGGGLADCVASWNCSEWGDCIEGIKTRECHDSNNCGTTVSMPETEKRCDIVLRTVLRYDLIFVDVLSGVCFIGIVSFVVWMIVKRKD
ncbi:MAG: right-handed parallel beta-helix repeat-containing protein, partial [Nanoarchaeota archaeon]|nr:right-handed parallel beta-helix repeat-containing protein [Nanoarchaeota archaeon]